MSWISDILIPPSWLQSLGLTNRLHVAAACFDRSMHRTCFFWPWDSKQPVPRLGPMPMQPGRSCRISVEKRISMMCQCGERLTISNSPSSSQRETRRTTREIPGSRPIEIWRRRIQQKSRCRYRRSDRKRLWSWSASCPTSALPASAQATWHGRPPRQPSQRLRPSHNDGGGAGIL